MRNYDYEGIYQDKKHKNISRLGKDAHIDVPSYTSEGALKMFENFLEAFFFWALQLLAKGSKIT